jgi:broad specificity phosphatase PhoE
MARGGASVPTVFFITHPDVAIDPAVAIPDWPLNGRGQERMRAITGWPWARNVRRIFASSEHKARDGAEILAAGLGLTGYNVVAALGETDRSATGYLPKQELEETADAFFAHPQESPRGWEPAALAQGRIVGAVERIVSQPPDDDDLAIVGHGGTGTLLYCHLAGLPISRCYDQPATSGGNWFAFDRATPSKRPDVAAALSREARAVPARTD